MYDRRYPGIEPIDRHMPGLSHYEEKQARRAGEEVSRRTGTRCFYVAHSRKLLFVYGDEPAGGPLQVDAKGYTASEIDDMVRYINLGKMSRSQKDRILARNEANEKQEQRLQHERWRGAMEKETVKHAEFLDRKRRGVETVTSAVGS
jgi:hypothetical protein